MSIFCLLSKFCINWYCTICRQNETAQLSGGFAIRPNVKAHTYRPTHNRPICIHSNGSFVEVHVIPYSVTEMLRIKMKGCKHLGNQLING